MENIVIELSPKELALISLSIGNLLAEMHELDFPPRLGVPKKEIVKLNRKMAEECEKRGISRF